MKDSTDLLIVDEAQEYTDDQESSLKYVVTDSRNPQTVFLGTPMTAVSGGTVFVRYRTNVLAGNTENSAWAEWSVSEMTDPNDKEAWYQCNPSLGTIFTERSIKDEIGSDKTDFNIQRLGLWVSYNQNSAIKKSDWKETEAEKLPKLSGDIFVGIKYGKDGTNVSLSVACRTEDKRIYISAYDCRSVREGNSWIINFLATARNVQKVAVDGANGQKMLEDDMKASGLKKPVVPTVKEFIQANAAFELAVFNDGIWHMPQPSFDNVVTNCEHRAIGSNGGFGYRSLSDAYDISLLDSAVLAFWLCNEHKERKKQRIRY